jgi:dihydroorotase
VDLAARLREPGHEHEGMLESEMAAAVAGGVTSLVCPPDTDPVLDEPGLVEMLKFRAEKLHQARLFPLGALTRGLAGEVLTEMAELTEAGCVGFGQAEVPLASTQVLQRALQYASTFGYTVWLRPQELYLGKGVAASGRWPRAWAWRRAGGGRDHCAAHHLRAAARTRARVHLCRLSSAAGVALVRQAKAEGLP